MPTNLPPECAEIEARYRAATSAREKIACMEELLGCIPKHKGTDHLRADLRRRLASLKEESGQRHGVSKQPSAFRIEREGAGQVAIIGPPNTGKSSLVAALTNAEPEIAAFPFTTWAPLPGMMDVEDVHVQLVDTPPLHPDHLDGEFVGLMRRADLLLLVLDLQADAIGQLQESVALLEQHHILPLGRAAADPADAHLTVKPVLLGVNKVDDEGWDADFGALCELFEGACPLLAVSAQTGRGLDRLKIAVFEALDIVRVYSKPPGKPPDLAAPFVLKRGSTIGDLAGKVHREILQNLKSARVWGPGVFDGQHVGPDYVIQDRDIVELRV